MKNSKGKMQNCDKAEGKNRPRPHPVGEQGRGKVWQSSKSASEYLERSRIGKRQQFVAKPTVDSVMRFLEVCQPGEMSCDGCAYGPVDDCILYGHKDALEILKELKAENEELKLLLDERGRV